MAMFKSQQDLEQRLKRSMTDETRKIRNEIRDGDLKALIYKARSPDGRFFKFTELRVSIEG